VQNLSQVKQNNVGTAAILEELHNLHEKGATQPHHSNPLSQDAEAAALR